MTHRPARRRPADAGSCHFLGRFVVPLRETRRTSTGTHRLGACPRWCPQRRPNAGSPGKFRATPHGGNTQGRPAAECRGHRRRRGTWGTRPDGGMFSYCVRSKQNMAAATTSLVGSAAESEESHENECARSCFFRRTATACFQPGRRGRWTAKPRRLRFHPPGLNDSGRRIVRGFGTPRTAIAAAEAPQSKGPARPLPS